MLQAILALVKLLWPIVKHIVPGLSLSPIGEKLATLNFAKIKDAVDTGILPVGTAKSKKLTVERVDQFLIKEENNSSACYYSSYVMQLSYLGKKKLVPEEFDDVCRDAGVINKNWFILAGGHEKIYVCAGLPQYTSCFLEIKKSNQMDVIKRVVESINQDRPCILSLNGKHFELVNGYEYINDELLLNIVDPGGWKDTHMETSTMRVFKFKGTSRIYSQKKGVQRTVTSFRLPVLKG